MQTLFTRVTELFVGLLPLAEQPDDADQQPTLVGDTTFNMLDEDRLPERDEGWYWAMHAHW